MASGRLLVVGRAHSVREGPGGVALRCASGGWGAEGAQRALSMRMAA
jgi:hypothetical protein